MLKSQHACFWRIMGLANLDMALHTEYGVTVCTGGKRKMKERALGPSFAWIDEGWTYSICIFISRVATEYCYPLPKFLSSRGPKDNRQPYVKARIKRTIHSVSVLIQRRVKNLIKDDPPRPPTSSPASACCSLRVCWGALVSELGT